MAQALRMLVVGVGAMGRARLGALAAHPHWRVVGLVDVSEAALMMAGESYGVPPQA